jgi:hypothetical protein
MEIRFWKLREQSEGRLGALRAAALAGYVVLQLAIPARADTGPVAAVLEPSFNFGSVSQGQKVEHEFVVRNDGDAELVIQRIAPSCGCTAAAMSASAIKPGAAEKIKVTFNTAGFHGTKTKSVSVLTNARNQQEITLRLQGTIVRDVTVTPERIDFGEIAADTSQPLRSRQFSVEVAEGADRQIASVRSMSKFLVVEPKGAQGRVQQYAVALSPDAPRGEFRDRIVVEFNDPDHSSVNVPVNASVVGDVRLIPSTVSFGIISGDQPMERRVRFENTSKQAVIIQEIKSSHPAVAATVLPVAEGRRGVIVINVDPRKVSGDLRASLEVTTSHPDEKVIALNVFGVLPPK